MNSNSRNKMTGAGMTALKSYCTFLLFRIHHCTSCSYRKPAEHMGNLQHTRYLHMAFSGSEQLYLLFDPSSEMCTSAK